MKKLVLMASAAQCEQLAELCTKGMGNTVS